MKREGWLGLLFVVTALTIPLLTWHAFYGISVQLAVTETPLYLFTMFMAFLVGGWIFLHEPWLGVLVCYSVMNILFRPTVYNIQSVQWLAFGALGIVFVRLIHIKWDYYIKVGFGALGISQTILAVQQWMGYDFMWFGSDRSMDWIHGSVGNPNYLGSLLVLCAAIAPWQLVPIMALGVILSGSRLAICVFMLVLVWRSRNFWVRALFALTVFWGVVGATIASVFGFIKIDFLSLNMRITMWLIGLNDVVTNAVVFGFGLSGWFERIPMYQVKNGIAQGFGLFDRAHNEYIQYFYESGLVGLIPLFVLLWRYRYNIVNHPSLIAIVLISMGMFPFHLIVLALPVIVLIGLTTREVERELST